MKATVRRNTKAVLGADKIAGAILSELVSRGHRQEEISLQWHPDPAAAPPPSAPELRAELADCATVRQMFSREELEVSRNRLDRESVVAKINLVVESLHAGLP